MQDIATEIVSQLEPSEPLGYRLVMHAGRGWGDLIFEAKAVAYRGRTAFMVRWAPKWEYDEPVPPPSAFWETFAPTDDALKYLIRQTYNAAHSDPCVTLMPPNQTGYDRMCGERISLSVGNYGNFRVDATDSIQERALSETVAALTLMRLPLASKW